MDICQKLTSLYWPNYTPHMWQGGPYAPDHAKHVQMRLKEVHSLRTLHKQLTQLLSHSEQDELKTSKSFEPFVGLNAVQYNPYTGTFTRSLLISLVFVSIFHNLQNHFGEPLSPSMKMLWCQQKTESPGN